jgi:hypothetical protein
MSNKKIASGEVPKAHYNALYKTASPAGTPKEGRVPIYSVVILHLFFESF